MTTTDNSIFPPLSSNSQVQPRAPKRQKIQIACDVCKSRKSKCDGARPACGPCSRRKGGRDAHLCNYRSTKLDDFGASRGISSGTDPRPSPNLQSNSFATTGISPRQTEQNEQSYIDTEQDNATVQAIAIPAPGDRANQNDVVREVSQVPSDGSASDRDVDAMGCVDGWALRSGLLGISSAANFAHQVRRAADRIETPGLGAKGSRSDHVTTKLLKLHRKRDVDNELDEAQLVLPQKKTADHLFEVYWLYSDVIFPWLDEEEIRRQYASMWIADDDCDVDDKVFYCTLNFMFAIATKLDPQSQPKVREKLAKTYYGRARDLLSFNLLDISHFQILQVLLLATQYLQSTNMPRQCFQMLGLAIWVAQDLGLHLPETTGLLQERSERELARRVWQGCITMDKIAAMIFGRPARISKAIADKADYPWPDGRSANLDATMSQSTEQPARYDFFIAYCKLHRILGDILEIFYTEEDDSKLGKGRKQSIHPATENLGRLFEIDHTLSNWYKDLSEHFKNPPASMETLENRRTSRQANTLHARYHFLRLMLFRPFFTQNQRHYQATTTTTETPSLESQATSIIFTECQSRCVEAAQHIIDLISKNLLSTSQNPQHDVLPARWFTVSYIFASSLVILAALLIPASSAKFSTSTLQSTLDRAYQVLQYYEAYTSSARRCRAVLRSIHRKVTLSLQAGQTSTKQLPTTLPSSPHHNKEPILDSSSWNTDVEMENFVLNEEDFSWLDTEFFFWDDESFSLTSLDSNIMDS